MAANNVNVLIPLNYTLKNGYGKFYIICIVSQQKNKQKKMGEKRNPHMIYNNVWIEWSFQQRIGSHIKEICMSMQYYTILPKQTTLYCLYN